MHQTEGWVVKVEGDVAYIQAQRQSSCCGCNSNAGCGTVALTGFFDKSPPLCRASNRVGAKTGDRVVIGMAEDALLKGALALYAPPVLLLLAGAIAGFWLAPAPAAADGYSIAGAAVGIAAGFFWARFHATRLAAGGHCQPEILSKVFEGAVVNFYEGGNKRC